ncbi:MAG TPA: hypothetical protein VGI81_25040 [Tepidisphaeraceae bacterium]|jgi:hypothetical protein
MTSPASKPPLEYGRPPRRDYVGLGMLFAPFVVLFVSAMLAAFGVVLYAGGSSGDRVIATFIAVPSALGTITLPIVLAIQSR